MKKQIPEILSYFARTAELLSKRGWAERNAGNISFNISDISDKFHFAENNSEVYRIEKSFLALCGQTLMVSTTNSRMRDLAENPATSTCFVRIISDNEYVIDHFPENSANSGPTSELPTHLGIHNLLLEGKRNEKAVVHTHPNELIAISHHSSLKDSERLSKLLWSMHPETIIFLPEGIGFVPYTITGSDELAERTIEVLKYHNIALWEKHGCIAVGENPLDAFDLIDTAAKSADIYFRCKAAGFEPEGLTDAQMKELIQKFGRQVKNG